MKTMKFLLLLTIIISVNLFAVTPEFVLQRVIDDDAQAWSGNPPWPGTAQSNFSPNFDNLADSVVFVFTVTNSAWSSGGDYEIIIDVNRDGVYDSSDWVNSGYIGVNQTNYIVWDGHNTPNYGSEGDYYYIVPNGNYNVRIRIDDRYNNTIDSNISTNYINAAPYTAVLTGIMTIIGSTNKSQVSMQTPNGRTYSNPVTNGQMYYIYGLQNQNYNPWDLYAQNIDLPSENGMTVFGDYNTQIDLTSGSNHLDITMDDHGKTIMSGDIIDYLSGDKIENVSVSFSPDTAFFLTAAGENTSSDSMGIYRDVYRGNGFYDYTIGSEWDPNYKYGVARGTYYINSNNSPITQNFYVGVPSSITVQIVPPQDNVSINLYDLSGHHITGTTTDTNGRTIFSQLAGNGYSIEVSSFSNALTGFLFCAITTNISLLDGEDLTITLNPKIGYRVYGTVRTNGVGAPNIPVNIFDNNGKQIDSVNSDGTGHYVFDSTVFSNGNYTMSCGGTVFGSSPYYKQKSTNVIVSSGNLQVDFAVDPMPGMITLIFTNWTHYTNDGAMVMAYGVSNNARLPDDNAALFLGMFSSVTTYMVVDSTNQYYTILLGQVVNGAPIFFQSAYSNKSGDTVIFSDTSTGNYLSGSVINSNTGEFVSAGIFLYTISTQLVTYINASFGKFNYTNLNVSDPYIIKVETYDNNTYKDKWFTGISANSTITLELVPIDHNIPTIQHITPSDAGMLTKKDFIKFYVSDDISGIDTNSITLEWISGTGPNFGTKTLSSGLSYSNGWVMFSNTGLIEGADAVKIVVADLAESPNTNVKILSFIVDTNAPVISVATFTDTAGTHDNVFGWESPFELTISLTTAETGNYSIYLDNNKNGIFDPDTDWYMLDSNWSSIHNQTYTNLIHYNGPLNAYDQYGIYHPFIDLSEGAHILVVDFDDFNTISPHDGNNTQTNILFYKDTGIATIASINTIDSNTLKIAFDSNSLVDSISSLTITGKTNVSTNIIDNIIYLDFSPPANTNENLSVSISMLDKGNNFFSTTTNIIATFKNAPSQVILISPVSNSISTNGTSTFVWHPATDDGSIISYELVINNLTNIISSPTTNFSTNLSEGWYFWKVRAVDDQTNYGQWSSVWNYGVDLTPPTQPKLITPVSNSVVSAINVFFQWTSSIDTASGIDYYILDVDKTDSSFSNIEITTNIPFSITNVSLPLTEGTKYWRVRAVDVAGHKSSYTVYNFVYTVPKIPVLTNAIVIAPTIDEPVPLSVKGTISNTFTFKITYKDAEGDVPGYPGLYTNAIFLIFETNDNHYASVAILTNGGPIDYITGYEFSFTTIGSQKMEMIDNSFSMITNSLEGLYNQFGTNIRYSFYAYPLTGATNTNYNGGVMYPETNWESKPRFYIGNPPDTVFGLSADWVSPFSISIHWDAVSNADSYIIYTNQFGTTNIVGSTTNTNYVLTGLSADKTYRIVLKSENIFGKSLHYSLQLNVHTALVPPTGVSAICLDSTNYTEVWNSVSGANGYKIAYQTNLSLAWSNWIFLRTTTTNITFKPLAFGVQHYVGVWGTNENVDNALVTAEPTYTNYLQAGFIAVSPLTNVIVTVQKTNQAIITWSDTIGETGYVIVTNSPNTANAIITLSSNITVWTDNNNHKDTSLTYYVIGTNWNSGYSTWGNATGNFFTPGTPSNFHVVSVYGTTTNAVLTWNDELVETGYEIRTNLTTSAVVLLNANVVSWTDTTVKDGQTITYYLRATNVLGKSEWASNTITINPGPPMTIQNVSISNIAYAAITVKWDTEPSANAYIVYTNQTSIGVVAIVITPYAVISNLQPNTFYSFVVKGSNNQGISSNYSNPATGTTADSIAPSIPVLITPFDAIWTNNNTITFIWNSSSDTESGVAGYEIVIDNITNKGITITNYTQSLSDGTHTWRVRSIDNSSNYSAFSAQQTISIDTIAPHMAGLISPMSNAYVDTTNITFQWNPATDTNGIDHYLIEIDKTSSIFGDIEQSATVSVTSQSFLLTEGTKYWRVRAYDMADNVRDSQIWTVTVDMTKPTIPQLVSPMSNGFVNSSNQLLVWNTSSDGSGVYGYIVTVSNVLGLSLYTNTQTNENVKLVEGLNKWTVSAIDNAGNESLESTMWIIHVDTIRPTIPNVLTPTNGTLSKDPTPSFQWNVATDTGSGIESYEINIDGFITNVGNATNYTIPSVLSDGTHTWKVRAIDNIGNIGSYSGNRSFTIDTTPPLQVSLIAPADQTIIATTNFTFIWNPTTDVTSGVDKYIFEVDNDTNFSGIHLVVVTNGTSYTLPMVQGTTNYWRVRAYDMVGNTNTSVIYQFSVDTNQIVPTLYFPTNASYVTSTSVNFVWSLEAGISSNQIVVDSMTNTFNSTNTNYSTILTESAHSWKVRVYKTGTGWQAFTGIHNFTIDITTPSTVSLLSPTDNIWTNNANPTLIWNKSTDANGIETYDVVIDNGTNSVVGTNYTTTVLSNGPHTWKVRAIDKAGNKGNFSSRTIYIDTNAPTQPSLVSPTNQAKIIDPTPIFVWNSASDTMSGIAYYDIVVDSVTNQVVGTNYTSTFLSNGSHTWKVQVVDMAGNRSLWSSNWIVIITNSDTIPPTTPILISPAHNAKISDQTPTFSWSASVDTNSGLAKYEFILDGVTNNVFGTSYTPSTALSEGVHTWQVRAIDNVGNSSLSSMYSFTIINQESTVEKNTFQVSPNPLTKTLSEMKITYNAKNSSDVVFEIYTIVGNKVAEIQPATSTTAYWYGKNDGDKEVASGMYLMIMKVGGQKVYGPIKIGYIRK